MKHYSPGRLQPNRNLDVLTATTRVRLIKAYLQLKEFSNCVYKKVVTICL